MEYHGKRIKKIDSTPDHNKDTVAFYYEDGTMEIIKRTTVKINLENGNHITTRINCTSEEACNYYKIGSYINIGTTADDMQKIKSLEFIYD